MKKLLSIILILSIIISCTTGCSFIGYDKGARENFLNFYNRELTIDKFCGTEDGYEISVQIDYTLVLLSLKRQNEEWQGALLLYEEDPKTSLTECLEEIPVSVSDDTITIHSESKKEIPLNVLFLYNFNIQNCSVEKSYVLTIDHPLEEIWADYPLEEMQTYMTLFYDEIITCLTKFEQKDEYFSAIKNLQKVIYIKSNMYPENPTYSISFGFDGETNTKQFTPGYGSFEKITLLFNEQSCRVSENDVYSALIY